MEVIFVLIAISLMIALGFLAAFFWAVKDGQFEDDYTPSVRILFDQPLSKNKGEATAPTKKLKEKH